MAAVPENLVEHGGWEGDEVCCVPGGEPGPDGGRAALWGELDEFEVAGEGLCGGCGGVWLVHFGLWFWDCWGEEVEFVVMWEKEELGSGGGGWVLFVVGV